MPWNDEVERKSIKSKINYDQDKIIQFEGKDIGLYSVSEHSESIYLIILSIIKEYQNRGIGTFFCKMLIDKANNTNKTLMLDTYQNNQKAISFYQRLGFKAADTFLAKAGYPKVKMEYKDDKCQ